MSIATLEELCQAYRKAKVDLYYATHASIFAVADYEDNLFENLKSLLERVNGTDNDWIETAEFLGTWTLAAKSVTWPLRDKKKKEANGGLIFSSPTDEWNYWKDKVVEVDGQESKPNAEFRIMARCSIDFHVISTLWMMKVGHLFDAKLTASAYGNRLRRTKNGKKINPLSLGCFTPYLKPFREWRDRGITAMRSALDSNKKVLALTADVSAFYHELNPHFMLESDFVKNTLSIELREPQQRLHEIFIHALIAWAKKTPLKRGLPVGLPASAVVANVALVELDRFMEQQVGPIYYGRYVDDIMLVMDNSADLKSPSDLWEWLFSRSGGNLAWQKGEIGKAICFQPGYLSKGKGKSKIVFSNSKNKVFLLSGETGKTLVDAIAHEIQERASEWRAMPRLPQSPSQVGTDLLAASQSDGEAADNLRKTDSLTMRRAGFAIKLRDFEAYERDLSPESWKEHRRAFFHAFEQHVLELPQFFELSNYLPRVIRLATACEDFDDLKMIIMAVGRLYEKVRLNCTLSIKSVATAKLPESLEIILYWRDQVLQTIRESVIASFPPRLSKAGAQAWQDHMGKFLPSTDSAPTLFWPESPQKFQIKQEHLFACDLAHLPFRFIGLPTEMVAQRGIPAKKSIVFCDDSIVGALDAVVATGSQILAKWTKMKNLPRGMVFATRPFNLAELYVVCDDIYSESTYEDLRSVVLALRGFGLNEKMPRVDRNGVLQVPDDRASNTLSIAVSSWKTHMSSWVASVSGFPDPDAERYARLNRLLNGVLSEHHGSRYLILPELALPAHWFIRIARKLQGSGISLITGIEYLHSTKARVRNQIWAALSHNGLGFPSFVIYRQDKQRPALHEELELQRIAGLKMKPHRQWKSPPIIQHGDFSFSMLVCSELTNIGYRADLRGRVDALFVPEWNQDIETFNALVESAALDVHAYIIQCNDRQYGDSRIRAPYKDTWMRDVMRVKGGLTDYCVIGEIDVLALRKFQSNFRSPPSIFKPVPDGFVINYGRKVLP